MTDEGGAAGRLAPLAQPARSAEQSLAHPYEETEDEQDYGGIEPPAYPPWPCHCLDRLDVGGMRQEIEEDRATDDEHRGSIPYRQGQYVTRPRRARPLTDPINALGKGEEHIHPEHVQRI